MTITGQIAFRTQAETSYDIESVRINLCDEDIENIRLASKLVNENKFIENIRIAVNSDVDFIDDEDEISTNDWRCDVMQFIVYGDAFIFYAQNKWESADQIESEAFDIEEHLK